MADQLELLFQALVRRVRDVRPEHLSRPFEVADILRTFVPYRTTRAEVGVETAEDYEVLVLRLLSGERGFVFADDAMQDDLRRELDSGNPDLRALHAYGTARVTLAQHSMRQVLEASVAAQQAVAAAQSPAPSVALVTAADAAKLQPVAPAADVPAAGTLEPAARTGAPAEPSARTVLRDAEGRVVATVERQAPLQAPDAAEVAAALDALQRTLPPTLAELGEMMGPAAEAKARAPFHARTTHIPDPTAESVARTPRPGCRFCGQMLPEGREVTFCPHCGQNLRVRRCPGCSAEIEPTWKFCVTCGRASASP
jgi:hypothetical protein